MLLTKAHSCRDDVAKFVTQPKTIITMKTATMAQVPAFDPVTSKNTRMKGYPVGVSNTSSRESPITLTKVQMATNPSALFAHRRPYHSLQ